MGFAGHEMSQLFTCRSKIRFATWRQAEKQRLADEEVFPASKGEMRAYRCGNCDSYHIGHWQPVSRKAERVDLLLHEQRRNRARIAFTIGDRLIESWRQE
jgi:hypothetical protein